jgi:hypothetical protein
METPRKTALVLSHAKCVDGAFAAWAARYHCHRAGYMVTVAFINPGDTSEILTWAWDIVFVVDVAVPVASLGNAYLLDHHQTNKDIYEGHVSDRVLFDLERSGAGLAWDEVQAILGLPVLKRPLAVDYVEDRDLWRFNLQQSEEVNAAIHDETGYDLARIEAFMLFPLDFEVLVARGERLLKAKRDEVARLLENEGRADLLGMRIPCVNSPNHQSDLGNALAKRSPFGAGVVWYIRQGVAQVSFRSIPFGVVTARALAESLGGGGHEHAAGVTLPLSKWVAFLTA